jgi:hypothetical protein
MLIMNVHEKYYDVLIRSSLLFVRGTACVKSIRSREACRSGACCFLYAAFVTPDFKAKPNAHNICGQKSSLHTYHTENVYRITNVII